MQDLPCAILTNEETIRANANFQLVKGIPPAGIAGCTLIFGENYTFRTMRDGAEANVPNAQTAILKDIFGSLALIAIIRTLKDLDATRKAAASKFLKADLMNNNGEVPNNLQDTNLLRFYEGIKRTCELIANSNDVRDRLRSAVEAEFKSLQTRIPPAAPIVLQILSGVTFRPFNLLIKAVELPANVYSIQRGEKEFGDVIRNSVAHVQWSQHRPKVENWITLFPTLPLERSYKTPDASGTETLVFNRNDDKDIKDILISKSEIAPCITWFALRVNVFLEIFGITPFVSTADAAKF